MKKVLMMLLVSSILLVTIPAHGETILFRNIPWGANISLYSKSYSPDEYISKNDDEYLPRWSARKAETDSITINLDTLYGDGYPNGWGTLIFSMDRENGLKVSGYHVSTVTAYFAYGIDEKGNVLRDEKDSRFYMAEYSFDAVDGNTAYADLKEKLTNLYGLGEETIKDSQTLTVDDSFSMNYIDTKVYKYIIKGDNNTVCMLEKTIAEDECISLSLVYADEKSDKMLDEVLKSIKNERLTNEATQSVGNYDGL